MPFLKMKSDSSTGRVREQDGLCVCPKSAKISKNSCSRVKILKETDIDLYIQNNKDVSVCNKINSPESGDYKDIDRLGILEDDDIQFIKHLSPLIDTSTLRTESIQNTIESTLFSPMLESIQTHMEANGLQFDNGLVFRDMGLPCWTDLYNESNTLFDVAEEYKIPPLLEDTVEATGDRDVEALKSANIDTDDSSLYFAISQLQSCDQDFNANTFSEQDQSECFDPHMFFRNQPDYSEADPNLQLALSQKMQKTKSVTLVLDLDETLVHSSLDCSDDANFSFPVFFNMQDNMVYVRQRPHLEMFLKKVAEMFDVVVFTAGQSIYANQLLDKLDPEGKLISRRLYRESCLCLDGNYIKDLTIFGVDLSKIAIIDNSPQVFQLQVNNGIPIESWFDDPTDYALFSLLPFLETLADADDVRPLIAERFGNKE